MTHKQRLFVEAYIANGGNGTRAALVAGYSPKCAYQQANENLQKDHIAAAIKRRMPGLVERVRSDSRKQRPCRVYVIAARAVSRFKIGITRREPAKRLESLQTGSPVLLELVVTFPGGKATETTLHRRFAHRHSHGEWFDLTPQDLDWLRGYADEQAPDDYQDEAVR